MVSNGTGAVKGTMGTLAMIIEKQGWKQLFSGLSINYLKVRQHTHIIVSVCVESHYYIPIYWN